MGHGPSQIQLLIIGLSGRMRSGKDTACDELAKCALVDGRHTLGRFSFAGALKDEVAAMYGVTREFIEEHKDNFRAILQGHGTNYRRQLYGEDYWVEKLSHDILTRPSSICIITDVRFPNEAQFITDAGGLLVRIQRSAELAPVQHESEGALDDWDFDFVLFNTGTEEDFQETMRQFWSTVVTPIVNGYAESQLSQ